MACKRSAVRSRLAPPAFARFASFGSASHPVAHRSEASEGCLAVARRAKAGCSLHNAGEVPHTSKYGPWRIRTYVAFSDERQAIAFEKYLKSGSGRAFAKKHL
jgi:putative endonuclease